LSRVRPYSEPFLHRADRPAIWRWSFRDPQAPFKSSTVPPSQWRFTGCQAAIPSCPDAELGTRQRRHAEDVGPRGIVAPQVARFRASRKQPFKPVSLHPESALGPGFMPEQSNAVPDPDHHRRPRYAEVVPSRIPVWAVFKPPTRCPGRAEFTASTTATGSSLEGDRECGESVTAIRASGEKRSKLLQLVGPPSATAVVERPVTAAVGNGRNLRSKVGIRNTSVRRLPKRGREPCSGCRRA